MKYSNGRTAIQLINRGAPYAIASVNLPYEDIKDNEIAIKDYSENQGMLLSLQKAGIVGKIIRYVESGFADVPICEFKIKMKNEMSWHDVGINFYARYQLADEPEILHVIGSGFKDLYFCFFEDAYETEPKQTAMMYLTRKNIKDRFKIEIKK